MKKLTSLIAIVLLSLSIAFAQTPSAKKVKPNTPNATQGSPKKKDGTADMRYKANKTAPVSGPKKKDGTADMRYKENKAASAAGPKKKDGTADMRYNANKSAKKSKN